MMASVKQKNVILILKGLQDHGSFLRTAEKHAMYVIGGVPWKW